MSKKGKESPVLRYIHLWVVNNNDKPTGRATVGYRETDGGLEFTLVFCQLDVEFTRANGRKWANQYFDEGAVDFIDYIGSFPADILLQDVFTQHVRGGDLEWRPASAIVDFLNNNPKAFRRPSWAKRSYFAFKPNREQMENYRPKSLARDSVYSYRIVAMNDKGQAVKDTSENQKLGTKGGPAPVPTAVPANQAKTNWPKTPSDF